MAEPNVTMMVIKVDLQCEKCYKKIKKVLCKFRQIRDQVFDEKQNTVTIKVVGCNPEKVMQKIRCKGGESVKDIQIKVPQKLKPPPSPDSKPPPPPDPKPPPPPDPKPPAPCCPPLIVAFPIPVAAFPTGVCCRECYGPHGYPPPCFCGGNCATSRYYVNRRDNCICEENPYACSIM
ncbi:heavy metal-associated isoprenylated plant protein 43 isoform X2 [Tripterygium wilfordii]|uniref:heavy metal-associated isoprenylated plant protein 43 isoform X2 n=1 Tax=Tripterygium wilfordii TaxID=458696 RepID=UPI0018F80C71|nr:heavy metal-associated isoprenylated plant protein 43 isoform X2 [Tripterygium wilfordii]